MKQLSLLLTSPQDFFIDFARTVGVHAAPYVDPLENAIVSQLENVAPTAVHHVRGFLETVESPLVRELPLMNPFHVLLIASAYLATVFLGVQIMKNFERFEIKTFSLLHNFVLVLISAYMCVGILYQAYQANYSLFENQPDHSIKGLPMAKMIWLFYFSKIMEFVDTMIMVLKKNNRQISFLHVYHHCSILTITWFGTFIAPNGEAYFSAAVNSFIHVIMYGYYFLSALGFKQVSFIKFYITRSQMIQFCMVMIQTSWDMYAMKVLGHPGPFFLAALMWFYMWSMLGLFYNYYRKNIKLAKQAKAAEEKAKKLH
ncbi:MAG: polyunsaturated fatty acid elongation enzyme [Podila humilis]|nr:MAG: polyunsaturated fatty acid elongation enzyme [Podila humilis]